MVWSRFFVVLALVCLRVTASMAAENRVAVVEAQPIDLPDLGPLALREAVINGIKAQGGSAVQSGEIQPRLAKCSTIECYEEIAKATGATYVLRIDGTFVDDRYDLQLSMWSLQTGQVVISERDRCKLCLAEDMLRIARNQTAYVVGKSFSDASTTGQGPPRYVPGLKDSDGSLTARIGGTGEALPHPRSYRWLGWTLGAAGVLAGATSAALFYVNAHKIDCGAPPGDSAPCTKERTTLAPAVAFGAGALGGIVAGGIILFRARSEDHSGVSVSVSPYPFGLTLGGRL